MHTKGNDGFEEGTTDDDGFDDGSGDGFGEGTTDDDGFDDGSGGGFDDGICDMDGLREAHEAPMIAMSLLVYSPPLFINMLS